MAKRKNETRDRTRRRQRPDKTGQSFWERLPLRVRHYFCLGFLLILPLAFFAPIYLSGNTFAGHDVIHWRAAAESIIEAREAGAEPAIWATNMFSGMPAYVISHSEYIPNFDTVVLPLFRAIFPVAQFWVLLGGLYFLFVLLRFRPLSAVFGAILIGFTTYIPIIIGAGHNTKFLAYCYVPWILVGYLVTTRASRYQLLGLFTFVLALILHMRASHPQVTYYFLFLGGAWWLFDTLKAYRAGQLAHWGKATALLLAGGLIVVGAVIQPYWSLYEYSPYSIRGGSEIADTGGLDIDYAFVWSQGWGELLTLAIPDLYGGAEHYWGPKPMTSGPHYFGAIAFLLFVIGLIKGSHRLKSVFLGVGVLTLLFSLGSHFRLLNEFMFYYFPGFDKFRTPEMWLIVTVFCFSIIAIMGLEWLFDRLKEQGRIPFHELYMPVGIVLGFGLLMVMAGPTFFSFEQEGEVQFYAQEVAQRSDLPLQDPRVQEMAQRVISEQIVPQRMEKAESDSIRFLLFAVAGAGILAAAIAGKLSLPVGAILIILLAGFDLLPVGARYMGEGTPAPPDYDYAYIVEQQRRPVDTFIEERIDSEEGWPYRVFPLGENPFNNAIPSYFYPSIGGYTGAKLSIYQDLIDHSLMTGPFGINLGVLDMLNVRYITYPQPVNLPGYRLAFEDQSGVVLENTSPLPKAFYVDSLVLAQAPEDALQAIGDDGFEPSAAAIVETEHEIETGPDAGANVSITGYSAREITIETSRVQPGFLVLSEVYYPPGWRAHINGEEVPIHRTNYVLRGIEVPAGDHTITFRFDPDWFVYGGYIAGAANVLLWLLLLAGLYPLYQARSSPQKKAETVDA